MFKLGGDLLKILIVARGYPNDNYKTNGIFEFDQAKAFAKRGHTVVYAAVDLRSFRRKRKWGFESHLIDGVHVEAINIPIGRIPVKFFNIFGKKSFLYLYKKILDKYGNFDIIHGHFIGSGYRIAHLQGEVSTPLVVTEHFSGLNSEKIDNNLLKMGQYTYNRVDKVIAVSTHLANNMRKNFHINPTVVPNIVDLELFKYDTSVDKSKTDKDFRFISVGNLVKGKGMDLLIEAFYMTFLNNDNVVLNIYGDGPEKERLIKKINALKLETKVFLHGMVNRQVIAEQLKSSNCFVLASKSETFGVSYIEALASGLPVIATDCGGPSDFVNHSNGIMIKNEDINELSKALKYMNKHIREFDNQMISNEIRRKYSPQEICKTLEIIYEDLISEKVIK